MNPDKQRIAIAEACGWVKVREHWEKDGESAFTDEHWAHKHLPDYLHDLNAMHEAEKVLRWDGNGKRDLTIEYTRCIYSIIDQESQEQFSEYVSDPVGVAAVLLRATAAQRAEAFLRCLGKWEEGE